MEVVGLVFIAPNHFLVVAPFLPTADGPRPWSGRSAPLVRTVRPCTSTTEISTVSSNGYINDYNALNASSDVRSRQSWTVREDAIIHFTEPITFGVFGSSPTGRPALGLGRC
jgi:hypothetical protein